jgi:uncharacterized protein
VISVPVSFAIGAVASEGTLWGLMGPEVKFSIAGAMLIGLGVGFLSGLLGVGGGFLLAPLLNGILGIPLRIAGPSDLCQIQGTSLSGLLRHRKQGNSDTQVAVLILGGTFCGTFVGVSIMEYLKGLGNIVLAGGETPAVEAVLSFLFLGMLVVIGSFVMTEAVRTGRKLKAGAGAGAGPRRGLFALIRIPPYVTPTGGSPVPAILVSYAGLLVGVLQALLGIGGGVLLLPILVYLVGVSTHAAVGTSLMIVFGASIVGTLLHALAGNISLPLVLALLLGGTMGSQFGALLSARIESHKLRKYFAFVVVAAMLVISGKLCHMYGLISWWPGAH